MKELQNYIYRHMDALKHHKRYLAMLTALSMLVTFIVPLILIEPADSMSGILICGKEVHTHNADCYIDDVLVCDMEEHIHTGQCYKRISTTALKGEGATQAVEPHNDNIPLYNAGGGYDEETGKYNSVSGNTVGEVTYSPAEVPLYTLLFGEGNGHWVDPTKSLDENLQIVNQEYFLGFANDFCAFIESDFTATEADAEGRMFVGGDLSFKKNWNYQIGSGDYGSFTPLGDTVEYEDISGFASAIVGGKLYRVNTLSTGHSDNASKNNAVVGHKNGQTVFYKPENGLYKNFIVGNINESLHYIDSAGTDKPYTNNFGGCNHNDYPGNCTICASGTDHDYIGQTNELSQLYQYSDVGELLEKTFDTIKSRSLSLASIQATEVTIPDNHVLTLDATNVGDAKTAYFRLDSWGDISEIVIKVPEDRVKYGKSKYTQDNETIIELDLNIIITCDDETININCPDGGRGMRTVIQDGNDQFQISKIGDDNSTNNHPISSNILYNFPNAKLVEFKDTMGTGGANFNGTIMAPYAHVKSADDPSPGHLSGALIAKSFYGGLEFGYRPYRGGADIFGMVSGYAVPVNKVDQSENPLPGALFAVKEDGKFVSLFESGNGTNFAALPSRVDFSKNAPYRQEEILQFPQADRTYDGEALPGEKLAAPVDFKLYSDANCQNEIKEEDCNTVLTKFYIKNVNNQELAFDYNENVQITRNENGTYTVQLIKPVKEKIENGEPVLVDGKPVYEISITGRNMGDSAISDTETITFKNLMTASVPSVDVEYEADVELSVDNLPTGDKIKYKVFANGTEVTSEFISKDQLTNYKYIANNAGSLTLSVKAYVEISGNNYEIAEAVANKINVKPQDLTNLKISTYNSDGTQSIDSVIQDNPFRIIVEGVPNNATVRYYFNDLNNPISQGDITDTDFMVDSSRNNIVGLNRPVKAVVKLSNGQEIPLEDVITVNFPENRMTLNIQSNTGENDTYPNDNEVTNYIVGYGEISAWLNGFPAGANLTCVVNGNTINPIDNNKNSWKIPTTKIGESIVEVTVEMNGLKKSITGKINGSYNNNLRLESNGTSFNTGDNVYLWVKDAPHGAKVVFVAVEPDGTQRQITEQTVNGSECSANFKVEKAGNYTIKANLFYGDNPEKVLTLENIQVAALNLNGELSVTRNQAYIDSVFTGQEIELKVFNGTRGANVTFEIVETSTGNVRDSDRLNGGYINDNGESNPVRHTINVAGNYKVRATLTMNGATTKVIERPLTVNESTSVLTGDFQIVQDNSQQITVLVSGATDGAIAKLEVTGTNFSHTGQSNINSGNCSFNFTPARDGVYTVNVTIEKNGQTHKPNSQKFVYARNSSISVSKNNNYDDFVPQEKVYITFSTNASDGTPVALKYYCNNNYLGNMAGGEDSVGTVSGGKFTAEFNPAIKGNYTVTAVIDEREIVSEHFTVNAIFNFAEKYAVGQEGTITLDRIDGESIESVLEFTINGQDVTNYSLSGNTITFVPDHGIATMPLYIKVKLSGQAETYCTKNVTFVGANELGVTALRLVNRSINDGVTDNLFEITAPENEKINKVRLAFSNEIDANSAIFTLEMKFTDASGNTATITRSNSDVTDGLPDYLEISASDVSGLVDIKKIEIKAIAGSITIGKAYPTYVKKATKITDTSAAGFTIKQNVEKEITIKNFIAEGEDYVQTLDSIVFNLKDSSATGSIYYALIKDSEETPVFVEAQISNGTIALNDLNAVGVNKVKIYTTNESLEVTNYVISSYIGSKVFEKQDDLDILEDSTLDIINYYSLVEQQAPTGYFKESTIYNIEVKENINLKTLGEVDGVKKLPKDVTTTITVSKKDGSVELQYVIHINDENDNERKITIDGVVFTITEDEDGNVVTVSAGGDSLDWDTTKPAPYSVDEDDAYEFYFDPAAKIIVPVDNKPIKYRNEKGLLFKKVDDNGATVTGVDISLVPETGIDGFDLWHWDENSSEWLIDYTKLDHNTTYKFVETFGGNKYDLAPDIYFKKTEDKDEIKYWTGSEEMPSDEGKVTTLDLSKDRVIRMVNTSVIGVRPKLAKVDEDGDPIEKTAKFALYAANGTELLNPIVLNDNGEAEFDFTNKNIDTKYVENNYLKVGKYYLQEITPPEDYEGSTKLFYFEVTKDDEGLYKITTSDKGAGETIGDIAWSVQNEPSYTIDELTFYYFNKDPETIKDVEVIKANDYWWTLDYASKGLSPKNVIGIKVKIGGTGNEGLKFMIRNANGADIWCQQSDQYGRFENLKPSDVPYEFGEFNSEGMEFIPSIEIGEKNTIKVSNEPIGTTMDLRVDKKWVGDLGIPELRKPVEVQLMRKTDKPGDENDTDYSNYNLEDIPTNEGENTEEASEAGMITLNADNDWTYTWEDLPIYINPENKEEGVYYYKVNEITDIPGYDTSYVNNDGVNAGGSIFIKNTAKTVDIPVEKSWDENGYDVSLPPSITLKLQVEIEGNWVDVPGKTLTVTSDADGKWNSTFTDLIVGYNYRVEEVKAPFGWKQVEKNVVTANSEASDTFRITNKYEIDKGSIALEKLWQTLEGDTSAKPKAIYLELYRSVVGPSYTETDAPWTDTGDGKTPQGTDYKNDYARLLQHSLYFYDANMCGDDVAENSALAWRTNCHTEDEIPGGYHDAGDHVMFGLPQGYAATMLGWTYYEFVKGNNKVNSADAEHFKVILERFYDFFVDSVRYDEEGNIKEILVQKGGGNIDHAYWGAPEKQPSRASEMFWRDYGADIAAEYAAALALGYLNFSTSENAPQYDKYLKVAKDLMKFAEKNPSPFNEWGVNKDETQQQADHPGFYNSEGCDDDMTLATAWLYKATGDEAYNKSYLANNECWGYSWNDVTIAALCAKAYNDNSWSTVSDAINAKIDENNPTTYFMQDGWGSARYNAIMQMAALVAANHGQNKQTYINWAEGQMNLLLGSNQWKDTINGVCNGGTLTNSNSPICLVTNFVPDGFNVDTPEAPHHRAASGWDDDDESSGLDKYKVNCGYDNDQYALIGAMVGGPVSDTENAAHTGQPQMIDYKHDHPSAAHSYIDDLHDYCCNEVSIDYNAGLVGAAAGLYYFLGSGERSTMIEGVEYGAYGLADVTDTPDYDSQNGLKSPTLSAESNTEASVASNSGTALSVLKSFAFRQTGVKIMADKSTPYEIKVDKDGNYYYSVKSGLNAGTVEITGNFGSVSAIEIDFAGYSGNFGIGGYKLYSGEDMIWEKGWMQSDGANGNPKPQDVLKHYDLDSPTTITKLGFYGIQLWSYSGDGIKEIRLYIDGLIITAEQNDIRKNDETKLNVIGEGDGGLSWDTPADVEVYKKEDGNWYFKSSKTGDITVTATNNDNNKTGEITLHVHDLEIAGADEVKVGESITLDKAYAPDAVSYKWYINGDETASDSDGKLTITGDVLGAKTVELVAYDSSNTPIATDTKTIKVYRLETYIYTSTEDNVISHNHPNNKYYVPLQYIPSGVTLEYIKTNVTGTYNMNSYVHSILKDKDYDNPVLRTPERSHNLNGEYSFEWNNSDFGGEIPTGSQEHQYAFEFWWGENGSSITITSVEFVYRKYDDKNLGMNYIDENGSPIAETNCTVRKGETLYFEVVATGGELGSVKLEDSNGEVQDLTVVNGKCSIVADTAGDYTITATMDDYIKTLNFTVKDVISISQNNVLLSGTSIIDMNTTAIFTVNNIIGENVTWSVEVGEGYTNPESEGVVTIMKGETPIATFNTLTGELITGNSGGEFIITAKDSYQPDSTGSNASVVVKIDERPKLPELPKDVFLESVSVGTSRYVKLTYNTATGKWDTTVDNLPMYDENGNPYYYYIKEVAYERTEGSMQYMTDHYLYSKDAMYMPYIYYNNGIAPVKEGTVNVAKVGNKFVSKQQGQLPSTGGSGVTTYYYLGGVIMLLSIAGFTGLKRRERKRRKE